MAHGVVLIVAFESSVSVVCRTVVRS